jgi:hypothetical protein
VKHRTALAVLVAAALLTALAPASAQAAETTVGSLQPAIVGANASTTILITGSEFTATTAVSISGCPATNPGATYPVPFPNPGPGQSAGSVQFVDATRILLTTPTIIPPGVCDVTVGGATLDKALTFTAAPQRLTLELRNNSGRDDSEVWVSVGYNCPLTAPSPPYPPGTNGCEPDGTINPDYAWPATSTGDNPNRYWYEAYSGDSPLPAFTGIRYSDLPGTSGNRTLSIANINSGVVYVSYGDPVNTGPREAGRAPSYLTSDTRFDVFELTFHGSGSSAGDPGEGTWTNQIYANVTAVSGLGILMNMTGWDNSFGRNGPAPQRVGSGIRWLSGLGIYDVYEGLAAAGADVDDSHVVVTSDGKPATADNFLRFVSPSTNEGSGYADLAVSASAYLPWVAAQNEPMTVIGLYTGAGAGSGSWYCYRSTGFSTSAATTLNGSYGFSSLADAQSAAQRNCIGGTAGADITTATSATSGTPGPVTSASVYLQDNRYLQGGAVATGNDLYNAIYRDFIVSFAYGYWGSAGWSTDRWLNHGAPTPAFSAAWPGLPNPKAYPRWNAYAEAIWQVGNAYGMPYSDTFENAGKGNPLVSGSNIYTLRVTLRPDDDWGADAALLPAMQLIAVRKGQRFSSQALVPEGMGSSVTYRVTPTLPTTKSKSVNGIWFNRTTGVIKGTPSKVMKSTAYVITAKDREGTTASAKVRLRVTR